MTSQSSPTVNNRIDGTEDKTRVWYQFKFVAELPKAIGTLFYNQVHQSSRNGNLLDKRLIFQQRLNPFIA